MDLRTAGSILYVSSADVSLGNGPGVNEREFILALYAAIGARAHFLIPQPENEVTDLPLQACTFCASHHRHNPIYFWRHIISQFRKASELLSRRKFDLLLFRLDVLPFAPFLLTKKYRIPYAIKTLGQGALLVLEEKGGWLGQALKGINRRMFSQLVANSLVADTDSMLHVKSLNRTLRTNSDKIAWIDNAANTRRFFPSSKMAARRELGLMRLDPVVGYLGNRPWERGALQLIEAAPMLLQKHPNLGLIILGDGKQLAQLQERAVELQIEAKCLFAGQVPFHLMPLFVNSIDVGVSISLRDDRRVNAELKVRQYLACGKPVVISPGSNDFVDSENFGSIVQPMDIEAIAAAIDRWLSLTPDERRRFARRASGFIRENLSMEAAIAKRIALWNERLQSTPNAIRNPYSNQAV